MSKTKIAFALAALVLAAGTVQAQTYQQIGNTTYSNGRPIANTIGNTTYGSNGTTYQQIGNTTYGSNGTTYQQIGNHTYGSNGVNAQTIGNTTYINGNGVNKTCNRIGQTTYCN